MTVDRSTKLRYNQNKLLQELIAFFDLDSTLYLDWVVTAIFYASLS